MNKGKSIAWIEQPHQVKKLEDNFGEMVWSCQRYKTPGTPNFGIVQPKGDDPRITEAEQSTYRSVVGYLLHLTKHSRPDISNAVRESSKSMDGATPLAFKEMKRLVKFMIDTSEYGFRIAPSVPKTKKWKLTGYTDSDWSGDKDNRHSVSGYSMFLNGAVVLWKSKLQKPLALSSAEAEYYALCEAAKDVKYISMVLRSLGIEVELPITIYCDNVGAIFMTENASATTRTKHVDARYHYVRELLETGFIRIIFVRSEDNKSDWFTKNVSSELYSRHMGSYIIRRSEVDTIVNVEGRVLEGDQTLSASMSCGSTLNIHIVEFV
jgi:hypothetical protein